MAKDPAFLFYSNDFEVKTKFFTHEQVGKYVRLLITQHQFGHLTESQIAHVAGTPIDAEVLAKFDKDENGLFFNSRLKEEVEKRQAFTESRRLNALKSKGIKKKASALHTHKRMENENEDENINKNKKKVSRGTPSDFMAEIRKNPAYEHIDIDHQLHKMDAWLLANPGRLKTKRFIINWLNKIEKPIGKQPIKGLPPEKKFFKDPDCACCKGTGINQSLPGKFKCQFCWK